MSKTLGVNRRVFCGAAAATVAAGPLGLFNVAKRADAATGLIRPFHVNVPHAQLVDLRTRLKATRWPDRETVSDDSQGVQLSAMREIVRYWSTDYDWRKCEKKLNALPQFLTEIDGVDIHFIHVRSKHQNALPLIVTHGWPGSVIEQLKIIGPLTNPTAYGGQASDAFHLVIPSVPGYGFSDKPATAGWGPDRTASAWTTLMKRLGYTHFVAQGGDIGGIITNVMGEQAPPELLGIHTNFPGAIPLDIAKNIASGDPAPESLSTEEKAAYDALSAFRARHYAYAVMMTTRPQTLYEMADSPVGLAAWLIDHGDGHGQPAPVILTTLLGHTVGKDPPGDLTRDEILDNITLYWLTNTAVSAARFYWENHGMRSSNAVNVSIPAAISVFPGEVFQAPRTWTERAYHKLVYYNKVSKGGHFAAWEQPQRFSQELRAGFRPLRNSGKA